MSVPAWGDQTIGTASRRNLTGIISGTGTYLAGLNKSQFKLLHCTSTGSGYTKDHLYLCLTDGSGVIDITSVDSHDHTTSGSEGGDFIDVLLHNYTLIDTQYMDNIDINMWNSTITSTGSVSETEAGWYSGSKVIKVSTGTTSGSAASLKLSSSPVNYTYEAAFQAIFQLDTSSSSIAFKLGYCQEHGASADDNVRKMGIVGCTSVNGNFFARSADGDSRSDSDMGVAFDTAVRQGIVHKQETGGTIDYYIDGTLRLTKSSDVPIDGEGCDSTHFRFTVKNNTAADRTLILHKLRMTYHTTYEAWDRTD